MDLIFTNLVNGLMLGALYAIVSVGLTLVFGIVKVINFAHGEFLMVAMFLVFFATAYFGVHPYVTLVVVLPLIFGLGMLVQRVLIEPLQDSDEHIMIFATVGLSIAMINLMLMLFGPDIYSTPSSGLRTVVDMGPAMFLTGQLNILIAAIALVGGIHLFLTRTQLGRAIRATGQNRAAAQLMGINVSWVYMVTFGIGVSCVGLAAVLIAPLYPTSPEVGQYFVLLSFVVVVMGGLGSISGALLAAMIIGIVDAFAGFYLGANVKDLVVFGIFLLVLIFRPQGLFGGARNMSHVS
ncbi:branched-chain amino acid ABC transporter permease [Spiribacter sp. C176]|uniref:Branched-chain amino acid ABC transporter permease n=1 Tax=Spiribacter salilacus TaxID=2664894 RepID=A0A6N7QP44_9GAMM|nr:branched-chain amino acid ABC transporter permease [Spiribacter salilacus]MRH77163.1 branched-chain amino acid ABC transporter permease [Spiribacter salilacus]